MLGRKSYTPEELDRATSAVHEQLAAYRRLADAVDASGDPELRAALEAFEPSAFNHMTLALDRYFVHRLRVVAGKDGNALNEVELIADALLHNGGTFRGNNVIKMKPGESVLELGDGDPIALSADQFERLSEAFLGEIRARFVGDPSPRAAA